jgi:hypothetical protein
MKNSDRHIKYWLCVIYLVWFQILGVGMWAIARLVSQPFPSLASIMLLWFGASLLLIVITLLSGDDGGGWTETFD